LWSLLTAKAKRIAKSISVYLYYNFEFTNFLPSCLSNREIL
jgi:hypothetical protein